VFSLSLHEETMMSVLLDTIGSLAILASVAMHLAWVLRKPHRR
jgi:hypothetical protein